MHHIAGRTRADSVTVTSGMFRIGVEVDDFRFTGNGFDLIGALPQPVPEPASLLLLGSGIAGLLLRRRRVA
jgi:hypothetical protein